MRPRDAVAMDSAEWGVKKRIAQLDVADVRLQLYKDWTRNRSLGGNSSKARPFQAIVSFHGLLLHPTTTAARHQVVTGALYFFVTAVSGTSRAASETKSQYDDTAAQRRLRRLRRLRSGAWW